MKRFILTLAILALSASAFASATPEEIRRAEASPAAATNFTPCPKGRPTGPAANIPGTLISQVENGKLMQYGTVMTPAEAYAFYCGGAGGAGKR